MAEIPVNPLAEERDAIKRIALSGDGLLLHRFLRRVLETVYDVPDGGALLSHNGRRTLARDLMAVMAEGIESNRAGSSSTDAPILARSGGPRAVAGPRTSRRGASAPGWGPESDAKT